MNVDIQRFIHQGQQGHFPNQPDHCSRNSNGKTMIFHSFYLKFCNCGYPVACILTFLTTDHLTCELSYLWLLVKSRIFSRATKFPVAVLAIHFLGGMVPPKMARAGARVCKGVWRLCPQWGSRAKPLVGGQGAKPPWSWRFVLILRQNLYANFDFW